MTATAAEALELALWLHRAPARRAALMGRPLPEGIGQLLRVAGGASDQVAAAARITGEDEATVLEAVRFYLQQILFQDDADAYRVLGLQPDADQAQAREHHRLLQHWLHPDRRGEDQWESAYAVKVNRAWTHLRTAQSRAAYDAALVATASAPSGGGRHGGDHRPAAISAALRPREPAPNRSRNLTLLVLLGCAGLLALIALRNDRPPEWRDDRSVLGESAPDVSHVPDGSGLVAGLNALGSEAVTQIETATAALAEPAKLAGPVPAVPAGNLAAPEFKGPRAVPAEPAYAPAPSGVRPAPRPREPIRESLTSVLLPPAEVASAAMEAISRAVPARRPNSATRIAVPVPDPLTRMRQARYRANEVLDYLGDPVAIQPPVWNDVATAEAAAGIRAALLARFPGGAKIELGDPKWRLSADGARMESPYSADALGRPEELGHVDLDFVWREDRLLVRHLELIPR